MPYSRILISAEQLEKIVSDLGQKINSVYQSKTNCLILVALEGAKYFAEDLLAKLEFPFEVDAIRASSYSGSNSTGTVTMERKDTLDEKIYNKNILLIDDIYDTGRTLSHILKWLNGCQPKNVMTCVLLEKEIEHTKKVNIDFLGTTIENVFAIGYGLDFDDQYRELPFIGELSAELIEAKQLDLQT